MTTPAVPVQDASAALPFPIVRLNERNYLAWTIWMEAYLRCEGLWDITSQPPAALDDAEERLNRRAYAAIVMDTLQRLHVRDSVVARISLT